ncbi:hypothetical protein DL770_002294 [Monosporascus sp. CRB-9-2]|nr:hypothetical protein DL770_002294 [Monosporascus sp. CRB-9-2]
MPPTLEDPIPSTSPLSSPNSFVTATASPPDALDITITDISTPGKAATSSSYYKARQLPPELKHHCQIYLEENLPLITLNLLNSLLSPSQDRSKGAIYCPPPNQLSVLSTILVHPDFTTRPKEPGWPEAATESLVYLRSLLSLVGPLNARFEDAFRFSSGSRFSRGATPRSGSSDSESDDYDDSRGYVPLAGKYAKDGVWARGQDFFRVVGWAFNCSVLYPNRWRHWKQWLEFLFDVLEADLQERNRLDVDSGDENFPLLRKSLIATYIGQRSGRNAGGGLKWIMKAIFADGSKLASSSFQEIWHKEHKGISKKVLSKRKRVTVNIEKGDFGCWLDDDSVYSSQASEPPTPQKRRVNSGNIGGEDFQALEPAFVESIPLRQRLFSLISYLCFHLPSPPFDLSDLYESFENTARSLPLPIFSALVNSSTSALRVDSQISLYQGILYVLMPSTALSPAKVDRARHDAGGISPAIIERCFLPYPANTIAADDNAKVSLLVENLVQIVLRDGSEEFGAGFRDAIEKGIQAREAKVNKKTTGGRGRGRGGGGGGNGEDDEEARMVLEMSGERLRVLASVVEGFDGEGEENDMDEDDVDQTFVTAKSGGYDDEDHGDWTTTALMGDCTASLGSYRRAI